MPYIEAKISKKLNDNQKSELSMQLSDAVSSAFSKPKAYIMISVEDEKLLFMADKKTENGAYISVKLVGNPSKSACQTLTKNICDILSEYEIQPSNVYITYHPVDLWGWNSIMF